MNYTSLKLSFLLFIFFIQCPAQITKHNLEQKLVDRASDILDAECGVQGDFSGTILITKKDSIVLERSCGEASKRFHIKNEIDTRFNIGSLSEMFITISMMQLYEQKLITFEDKISKYITEDWLPRTISDKITIHHLLSHSSGLGFLVNSDYKDRSRELFFNLEDYIPFVKTDTLNFEPGSSTQYSNVGVILLAVLLEKVSGKKHFEYILEHIFEPLDMQDTNFYDMNMPIENLAIGYYRDEFDEWKNNFYTTILYKGPSGGIFSTVQDLHKFGTALFEHKLISRSSTQKLSTIQIPSNRYTDVQQGYGYGFFVREKGEYKALSYFGFAEQGEGTSSGLFLFPKQEYIICILSNYDKTAIEFAGQLGKMISKTWE
ncbi:serine hydrolase domain-containing protein [Aquimarina pacifica]|uniref:serine hydrolase domain-containing protein n=1 Tax=Aquimarina pacifica TaxID=1296415 RepID=UPI00046E609A|nr:serine hydrolase domain-containing protein [Aquimarina pacifica]